MSSSFESQVKANHSGTLASISKGALGRKCNKCLKNGAFQRSFRDRAKLEVMPLAEQESIHSTDQEQISPLDQTFGPRLGHDFSRVRVHAKDAVGFMRVTGSSPNSSVDLDGLAEVLSEIEEEITGDEIDSETGTDSQENNEMANPLQDASEDVALAGVVVDCPYKDLGASSFPLGYIDLGMNKPMSHRSPRFEIWTPQRAKGSTSGGTEGGEWAFEYRTGLSDLGKGSDHQFRICQLPVGTYRLPKAIQQSLKDFSKWESQWAIDIEIDSGIHAKVKGLEEEHAGDTTCAYNRTINAFEEAAMKVITYNPQKDWYAIGKTPEEACKNLMARIANDIGDTEVGEAIKNASHGNETEMSLNVQAALERLVRDRCSRTVKRDQAGYHSWSVNRAAVTIDKAKKIVTLRLGEPNWKYIYPEDVVLSP